jgi:hypothetical protein
MARTKGSFDYKNKVLIKIVNELLPNDEVGWEAVATAYFNQSKEEVLCNTTDVRKHWIKNLCNNTQKLTGRMGKYGDWIHRCMLIEKKNMKKTHSGMIGLSSDSDSLACNDGDENSGGGAAEGAGRNIFLVVLYLDLEYDDEGNQIILLSLPPPLCCSPHRSIPVAATVNKEVQQQAPGGGNNNKEDMTPSPALMHIVA